MKVALGLSGRSYCILSVSGLLSPRLYGWSTDIGRCIRKAQSMTISSSLAAGVAGLNSNASRLATIADNIANSATYGYKRSTIDFSSLVVADGGGRYSAGGVRTSSFRLIDERDFHAEPDRPCCQWPRNAAGDDDRSHVGRQRKSSTGTGDHGIFSPGFRWNTDNTVRSGLDGLASKH